MKRIYLLILYLFLLFGCKKDPFDYRTKYVGDYNFEIHYQTWGNIGGSTDTTYSTGGKIDYGSDNVTFFVFFNDGNSEELTVYEDGTIQGNHIRGEFESSKKLTYSYVESSLGGKVAIKIIGEKK